MFNVYRFDRTVSHNKSDAWRRYGGVAVLVHLEIHSRRLVLYRDDNCEFVAVEIKLKPIPLIIYAVYMRLFDVTVATKHLVNITKLSCDFPEHRIMVLGDFNIKSVRWIADETNQCYLPMNVGMHENEFLNRMEQLPFHQMSNITNAFGNWNCLYSATVMINQ